jgi:hypothetical protein
MPRCWPRVLHWCSRPIPDSIGSGAWMAPSTNLLFLVGPMCHIIQVFVNYYIGARRGEGRSIEIERTMHVGLRGELGLMPNRLRRFKVSQNC